MSELPQAYIAQMKRLLGEAGFFAYERALEQPVQRALRLMQGFTHGNRLLRSPL